MTRHADVHLEKHRVRAVGDVDVASGPDASPNVRFDPATPSVTVGGGDPDENGEIRLRDAEEVAVLSANGSHGSLVLSDGPDPVVSLDADTADVIPAVRVGDGGQTTATVRRGGVDVRYASAEETPAVEADDAGTLSVTDDRGRRTVELRGKSSALVLSGPPETGPRSDDEPLARYGGGELVLRSRSDGDVHLHATGERDSSYGADADNHPRIYLNGPEAALELGRHRVDADRRAKNGEMDLRTETGQSVLELRATENRESEVVFRWSDGSTATLRGKLRSHPDGLMLYDAGGHEALLVTAGGELRTRRAVNP